ncbi:MAG: tRNA pseudouridine(55) synthase TruB [Desulfobacteraceae bacterium IS3]|nr:MAG: tRNA pseudouridine(55) synthase TruB [Desulfobacteraceae bacterium IS3]
MELNGIFVIDKPENSTSARVVARVKKLLGVKKAGHTGTLDPFATGVTLCCVNQATKLARFFLHGDKTYQAVLRLGVTTDTQDLTGTVLSECEPDRSKLDEKTLRSVFRQFEGKSEQMPPVYSALKHEGTPLYKLARKGNAVQKPARPVFISSLEISDICLPEIHFRVSCSAGTYIRTLAADIGSLLGCGAHLKALQRVESSGFTIEESLTLSELEERVRQFGTSDPGKIGMISMSDALREMPGYVADERLREKIRYGKGLSEKDIPLKTDTQQKFIKITDKNDSLIAILSHVRGSDIVQYCCVFQSG